MPEKFCIKCKIKGDPLVTMPSLNPIPNPFTLTGRYTKECKKIIDDVHDKGFLWQQETALIQLHV
jgi:hypothetical protein